MEQEISNLQEKINQFSMQTSQFTEEIHHKTESQIELL